jgi:TPR repeat protein
MDNIPSIPTDNTSSVVHDGDYYYQQALQVLAQMEQFQQEEERRKSEELYQAWQQAQERANASSKSSSSLRAEGVAVIKTIAKQARRDQQQLQQRQYDDNDGSSTLRNNDRMDPFTKQSVELLHLAAQHGNVPAMIRLGNVALKEAEEQYQQPPPPPRPSLTTRTLAQDSLQQALSWYQTAGEHGSAEAWYNLGHLLWVGFPAVVEENDVDHEGDTNNNMSDTTISDILLLAPDRDTAMQAFNNAIDLGDPDAMYFVGVHHLSSSPAESNTKNEDDTDVLLQQQRLQHQQGLALVERAAQLGHGGAKYYLALFYRNGHALLDIAPCSPADDEFVKRLNDAVDAGDVHALYLRGHCYYHGEDGYPQDYVHACQDFSQAAQAGHAEAAVSAGAMLHQGMVSDGVSGSSSNLQQDQRRAFELYQRAGELGSVEGWRNVAACYALGEGVPQCMATANYIIKTVLKSECR